MPRAAYDTTCDIYHGPNSASPNALKGTCACRLVPVDAVFQHGVGAPENVAWLTLSDIIPTAGWKASEFALQPSRADRVAVPSGSGVQWWVFYVERVVWWSGSYYRAMLCNLPAPTECDCGAVDPGGDGFPCEDAINLAYNTEYEKVITGETWMKIECPASGGWTNFNIIQNDDNVSGQVYVGPDCDGKVFQANWGPGGCIDISGTSPDWFFITFVPLVTPSSITFIIRPGTCGEYP